MADRYNGMKRARDWKGQRVELAREIANGYCRLPAGYAGTIVSQSAAGLTFEGDPCGCCKVQPRVTRLGYHDVRVADGVKGRQVDGDQPLPDLILQLHREGLAPDEIAATLAHLGRDSEADAAGISIRAVIEDADGVNSSLQSAASAETCRDGDGVQGGRPNEKWRFF